MNITTKYDMGQTLFAIHQTAVERPPVKCAACDDGTVILRGESYSCPRCNGRKTTQASAQGWVVTVSGCVGNIRVEYKRPDWNDRWGDDWVDADNLHLFIHYMLDSTGINSGTLYQEPNVFASREEAQTECDRRNGWSQP